MMSVKNGTAIPGPALATGWRTELSWKKKRGARLIRKSPDRKIDRRRTAQTDGNVTGRLKSKKAKRTWANTSNEQLTDPGQLFQARTNQNPQERKSETNQRVRQR
jgi:hypothetical protein